jgi:diguanylate cyclase (GGDEF)-like protein
MKPLLFVLPCVEPAWQTTVLPAIVPFLVVSPVANWAAMAQQVGPDTVALVALDSHSLPDEVTLQVVSRQGARVVFLAIGGKEPPDLPDTTEIVWDWIPAKTPASACLPRLRAYTTLLQPEASLPQLIARDELTELVNRRYFLRRLADEAALAQRYHTPLAVVVLAAEGFGFYLDTFGYDVIHHFIRRVVGRVGHLIRQEDTVARLGDNEIALLMPRMTEVAACGLLDRLQADLSQVPLTVMPGEPDEDAVRLMAGVASWPIPDDTSQLKPELLLRYARHALHLAQHQAQETAEMDTDVVSLSVSSVSNSLSSSSESVPPVLVLTYCPFSAITPRVGG